MSEGTRTVDEGHTHLDKHHPICVVSVQPVLDVWSETEISIEIDPRPNQVPCHFPEARSATHYRARREYKNLPSDVVLSLMEHRRPVMPALRDRSFHLKELGQPDALYAYPLGVPTWSVSSRPLPSGLREQVEPLTVEATRKAKVRKARARSMVEVVVFSRPARPLHNCRRTPQGASRGL